MIYTAYPQVPNASSLRPGAEAMEGPCALLLTICQVHTDFVNQHQI